MTKSTIASGSIEIRNVTQSMSVSGHSVLKNADFNCEIAGAWAARFAIKESFVGQLYITNLLSGVIF